MCSAQHSAASTLESGCYLLGMRVTHSWVDGKYSPGGTVTSVQSPLFSSISTPIMPFYEVMELAAMLACQFALLQVCRQTPVQI